MVTAITRTFILYSYLLCASTGVHAQRDDAVPELDRIRSHVYNLADDSMMGRMATTEGYDMAARYVAEALRGFGVAPAFGEGAGGRTVSGYSHEFSFALEPNGPDDDRSYNVVGLVRGTDERLRSQLVVVSAHLDHVGTHDGAVFNGASDNASGVAVVLELARLIAQQPLRRTVLFAFFGAEEEGLIGSAAFVELMSGDEADIIVNVNVDEVGHLAAGRAGRPLVAVLTGRTICNDFMKVVREAGLARRLEVSERDPNGYFPLSDHYSFHQADIPVLFFTSGWPHRWLHAVNDDPNWIRYQDLQRVASLALVTVKTLGNDQVLCEFMR